METVRQLIMETTSLVVKNEQQFQVGRQTSAFANSRNFPHLVYVRISTSSFFPLLTEVQS
jgi:hypothetical protein